MTSQAIGFSACRRHLASGPRQAVIRTQSGPYIIRTREKRISPQRIVHQDAYKPQGHGLATVTQTSDDEEKSNHGTGTIPSTFSRVIGFNVRVKSQLLAKRL